ncbi:MAG: hypothetical protein CV045_00905 [Cyanobacteria bacterium M5B4]|nr:MAG: hypothetical protein CV045_00905 [Cyanobacteria bacterium M5B4]
MNSHNQPQKSDVVLGGTSPNQALVMGGVPGLKQALYRTETITQRQEILQSALNYGREGIEIVLQFLRHQDKELRIFAYSLLCERKEDYVQQALQLFSPSGIYYLYLQKLLRSKQWGAANQWTIANLKLLCHAHLQLNSQNFLYLPCADLLLIDRLWQETSNDRFGFSTQAVIWRQCTQLRWDQNQAMAMFGDRVGWRVSNILFNSYHWKRYDDLNFSLRAPRGHLPWINGIFVVKAIHDRLLGCKNNI